MRRAWFAALFLGIPLFASAQTPIQETLGYSLKNHSWQALTVISLAPKTWRDFTYGPILFGSKQIDAQSSYSGGIGYDVTWNLKGNLSLLAGLGFASESGAQGPVPVPMLGLSLSF